jgi:hypothetical protein
MELLSKSDYLLQFSSILGIRTKPNFGTKDNLPHCDEREKRAQWLQNAMSEARKQLNETKVFTTKFYQKQHHSGHATSSVVPFDSSVSHAFPSSFDTHEHTSSSAVTCGSDFSISHSSFGTDNQVLYRK